MPPSFDISVLKLNVWTDVIRLEDITIRQSIVRVVNIVAAADLCFFDTSRPVWPCAFGCRKQTDWHTARLYL